MHVLLGELGVDLVQRRVAGVLGVRVRVMIRVRFRVRFRFRVRVAKPINLELRLLTERGVLSTHSRTHSLTERRVLSTHSLDK